MNDRKNQNSLLVLATLGVYLGLVLAGATPTVWAQAATAKQFSVKDEAGQKDDLDNKPDDCREGDLEDKIKELETTYLWYNHTNISFYESLVNKILETYSDVDAFDINYKSVGNAKPVKTVRTKSDLIPIGRLPIDFDFLVLDVGNGFPGNDFSFISTKNSSEYSFKFESRDFSYDAPLVRYLYNAAFDYEKCREDENIILHHTEIKVEGANLIITTRLPRGSLDTLLASDAK